MSHSYTKHIGLLGEYSEKNEVKILSRYNIFYVEKRKLPFK